MAIGCSFEGFEAGSGALPETLERRIPRELGDVRVILEGDLTYLGAAALFARNPTSTPGALLVNETRYPVAPGGELRLEIPAEPFRLAASDGLLIIVG